MSTDANNETSQTPNSERSRSFFARNTVSNEDTSSERAEEEKPTKWSMGVLNDPETHEVPGALLFLS